MRAKRGHRKGIFATGHHDQNHADIVAALSRYGPEPYDTSKVGRGFPDLIWPFQGVTVAIEIKTPDGLLTPAQILFAQEWRGGPLFVISRVDQIPAMIAEIQKPSVRNRVKG